MCTPTQGVWQPAGCVSCEPVCVCVSLVRVVIICPASTHTALVSSPSLAVLHLSTYLPILSLYAQLFHSRACCLCVSRALRGGSGKEEPLPKSTTLGAPPLPPRALQAAPGNDGLPPTQPPLGTPRQPMCDGSNPLSHPASGMARHEPASGRTNLRVPLGLKLVG